jgi:hypothetical protein
MELGPRAGAGCIRRQLWYGLWLFGIFLGLLTLGLSAEIY